MIKRIMLLVCLGLLAINLAFAGEAQAVPADLTVTPANQTNDRVQPKQWLQDTGAVWTSPKGWDSADWGRFALYGGLTYLVHEKDDHLQKRFQERRSKKTDRIADVGNAFPVVGAVYLTGAYLSGNERQRSFAARGLESMAIALLTTEVISFAADRDRPDGSSRSFPSSHTAAAFALATVIADEYRNDKTVSYLAYGFATMTAYGRLNDNKHWGADVVAGALIGHYTAKQVGKLNASRKLRVQPYTASDTRGVVVSKQF